MDLTFTTYLVYLTVSVLLTVWVAHTLSKNGLPFLEDVFRTSPAIAASVNHLLVVGFYLLNLGFISFNLKLGITVRSAAEAMEVLSQKVGLVLLVLGAMHFLNLWLFHGMRQRALLRDALAPLPPDGTLPDAMLPSATAEVGSAS